MNFTEAKMPNLSLASVSSDSLNMFTSEQVNFVLISSPIFALFGYFVNGIVCAGLSGTTSVKKPTAVLMFSQMCINFVAVTCYGFGAPLIVYRQNRTDSSETFLFQNDSFSRKVASVSAFCIYASLSLLLASTANRFVFIYHPLRAERLFTYKRAWLCCAVCLTGGALVAGSTLFDCCHAGYLTVSLTFSFDGPMRQAQFYFAWAFIAFVLGTTFCVYASLIYKIRKTKSALAAAANAQRRILFGMETRLCLGFGMVAMAWFVHLTTIILPLAAFGYNHPRMSIFYATCRWFMFTVDPIVYLVSTKDLRAETRKRLLNCMSIFRKVGELAMCRKRNYVGGRHTVSSVSETASNEQIINGNHAVALCFLTSAGGACYSNGNISSVNNPVCVV